MNNNSYGPKGFPYAIIEGLREEGEQGGPALSLLLLDLLQ